jgi:hypothetical protein
MTDPMTATEAMDALQLRSVEAYRKSMPFARRIDSIVAYVMQQHGPVDPHKADRDAHRIAQDVAAMLLQAIYEDDGEIRNLKAETDAIRQAYEKWAVMQPMPIFISRGRPTASPAEP